MTSRNIARLGLLIALAFVFSYIEYLIPINIGIPGAKLGLANLVIMVALYAIGDKNTFFLSIVRVVLVGFTFGNMAMMMYSMAGALLSFAVMVLAKRTGRLSVIGVSVLGGVFHNVGQIIVAIFVLETTSLIYYLPVLVVSGVIAGIAIGILGGLVTVRIAGVARE